MKKLFYFLTLLPLISLGQIDINEEVFWDMIDEPFENEIYSYSSTVHSGMLNYALDIFKNHKQTTYKSRNPKYNDIITLSESEKIHLIKKTRELINKSWVLKKAHNLIAVDSKNIYKHLSSNRNNVLYSISHPIFIRDGSICLVFKAQLCCGGIYGGTSLKLYKKHNGKWLGTITISSGAF